MSAGISTGDIDLVNNYWSKYVDGFVFDDLTRGIDLAKANYLVALGEMCYIDYFGKLMRGRSGAYRNFTGFIKAYLPQYTADANALYVDVRSGLAHAYFPDNIEIIGVTRASAENAIWRDAGKWKIAVKDFIDELRKGSDALKVDLLNGVHLREFKRVVRMNPGTARILPPPPAPAGAPPTPTTGSMGSSSVSSSRIL